MSSIEDWRASYDPKLKWLMPPEEDDKLDLPLPSVASNGIVEAMVDGHLFGVSIDAILPTRYEGSRFWDDRAASEGVSGIMKPVRLVINSPKNNYAESDAKGQYPEVVMENGTLYQIGLHIPGGMIGNWSDEMRRGSGSFGCNSRDVVDVYQERTAVGVLVRLDGYTPLSQTISGNDESQSERTETFTGFFPDFEEGPESDADSMLCKKRVERVFSDEMPLIEETDLVFASGRADGKSLFTKRDSSSGLVRVIFVEFPVRERLLGHEVYPSPKHFRPINAVQGRTNLGSRAGRLAGVPRKIKVEAIVITPKTFTRINPLAIITLALVEGKGMTAVSPSEGYKF